MAFRVKIDDAELRRLLGSISKSCRNLEPPLTGWGNKLVAQTEDQFNTQTDPDGDKWADLAPSTLLSKVRGGYPASILTRKGEMRKSFRIKVSAMQLELLSDSPYLKYHQRGTSRMPQRVILGITPERKNEGAGIVRAYLKGKAKKK